jgi:hypothetical protein
LLPKRLEFYSSTILLFQHVSSEQRFVQSARKDWTTWTNRTFGNEGL